jgi:hypothetical protein
MSSASRVVYAIPVRRNGDRRMMMAKSVVRNARGQIFEIHDLEGAQFYVDKFFSIDDGQRRKFVTLSGFSSAGYVQSLGEQGLLKTCLAAIKELNDRAVQKTDPHYEAAREALVVLRDFIKAQPEQSKQDVLDRLKHDVMELNPNARLTGVDA